MEYLAKTLANKGLFNTRDKYYRLPNGEEVLAETIVFSRPIFNPDEIGNDVDYGEKTNLPSKDKKSSQSLENRIKALKRARKRVYDLLSCNSDLDMFVTLTLDKEKISRTDWDKIVPKLNIWLDNMVRRRGLRYVLVPEFHKDGESIHFHGIMNRDALTLVNSGVKQKGKVVYNVTDWKYGFTTAKRITSNQGNAVAKYITKYITKSVDDAERGGGENKVGGKYYLHGGALREPIFRYRETPYEEAQGFEVEVTEKLRCRVNSLY